MQIFKKMSQMAVNHDLTLPLQSTRRELPESSGILEKGLICVELRPFYCRKEIAEGFKSWFDTAVVWSRCCAAISAKIHGFTKQNHIRGDETLKL